MLYCENCRILNNNSSGKCKDCGSTLRNVKENDMVFLIRTSRLKSNTICDKLVENKIKWKGTMLPFNEDGDQEVELYVRYKDYMDATEIIKNIKFTELSPRKRSFFKVLSIIILIMIICAIAWGVDSIAYIIKNLL